MGKSGLTPAFRFLKLTYGNYLKRRYRISSYGIEDVVPYKGPAIVFGNHTHTLDPFFISAVYPYTIRWVAGSYLFKMKGLSFLLRHLVKAMPKVQGRSDLETIRSISRALKQGDIVGLFPEGTRNKGEEGSMLPFHDGALKIAEKTGCAIIPMSMNNTQAIFEAHLPFVRRTHVILEYGAPIYPDRLDKETRRHLGSYCQNIIQETILKNRDLV